MRKIKSILLLVILLFALPTRTYALTLSDWEQNSQLWKEAYVFAVMEYVGTIVNSGSQSSIDVSTAYQKCFSENKFTSTSAAKIVGRYILRTPESSTVPMVVITLQALREACGRYMPQAPN